MVNMRFSLDNIAEDISPLNVAILELLESNEKKPVKGKVAFQKEMFLIGNLINEVGEKAEFISHSFGPYSEASEYGIENLVSLGLVDKKGKNTYEITDTGSKVLEKVRSVF
jgi:uncharacterized protein YwgA